MITNQILSTKLTLLIIRHHHRLHINIIWEVQKLNSIIKNPNNLINLVPSLIIAPLVVLCFFKKLDAMLKLSEDLEVLRD